MNLGIQGKKALIIGASKGIGKGIALAFAEERARLVIVARTEELLQKVSYEAIRLGAEECHYEAADIMNSETTALAEQLIKKYGSFDIVVHNVGTSLISREYLNGKKDWLYALELNAVAAIDMNSVLIPPMIEKGWGRVIHISSISGVVLRGNPLYASSKAFLNAYVTSVGRQLASKGIVMSSVMPGAVAFENSYWDLKQKDDRKPEDGSKSGREICEDFLWHHQAINRFGAPEEVANAVLFMASEKASFMPAANISVDGANM